MLLTIKNKNFKSQFIARRRAKESKAVLVVIKKRHVYADIEWDTSFLPSESRNALTLRIDEVREDLDSLCESFASPTSQWSANEHGLVTNVSLEYAEYLANEIEELLVDLATSPVDADVHIEAEPAGRVDWEKVKRYKL